MEKLMELVELCKQRQQMFVAENDMDSETLFKSYGFDDQYAAVTRNINRLAKTLRIYNIRKDFYGLSIAFESLTALNKVTSEQELSQTFSSNGELTKYSISMLEGTLDLYCFGNGNEEEHKNAQAI